MACHSSSKDVNGDTIAHVHYTTPPGPLILCVQSNVQATENITKCTFNFNQMNCFMYIKEQKKSKILPHLFKGRAEREWGMCCKPDSNFRSFNHYATNHSSIQPPILHDLNWPYDLNQCFLHHKTNIQCKQCWLNHDQMNQYFERITMNPEWMVTTSTSDSLTVVHMTRCS